MFLRLLRSHRPKIVRSKLQLCCLLHLRLALSLTDFLQVAFSHEHVGGLTSGFHWGSYPTKADWIRMTWPVVHSFKVNVSLTSLPRQRWNITVETPVPRNLRHKHLRYWRKWNFSTHQYTHHNVYMNFTLSLNFALIQHRPTRCSIITGPIAFIGKTLLMWAIICPFAIAQHGTDRRRKHQKVGRPGECMDQWVLKIRSCEWRGSDNA